MYTARERVRTCAQPDLNYGNFKAERFDVWIQTETNIWLAAWTEHDVEFGDKKNRVERLGERNEAKLSQKLTFQKSYGKTEMVRVLPDYDVFSALTFESGARIGCQLGRFRLSAIL